MAKTIMYLLENNLTDLRELGKVCDAAVQKFNDLSDQSKAVNARMKGISELQKHIGAYSKTREIYAQYRKLTGRKQEKFYKKNAGEITTCQVAKRHFDSCGLEEATNHAITETGVCHIGGTLRVTPSSWGMLQIIKSVLGAASKVSFHYLETVVEGRWK